MTRTFGSLFVAAATLALALGNAGCATTRCADGAARLAAQAPVALAALQVDATDGVCLQSYSWKGPTEVKGVVIVHHGIRDHASRYGLLAEALANDGYAVYSHDMRGHGYSGGDRQRFDSIDQLTGDLDLVVQRARGEHPGKPVFLYGHSLGGLVTSHYTLAHQGDLAGVVLSGAALELLPSVTSGQVSAARFFGTVLPGLPAQEIDDSVFVSTKEALDDFMRDPLVDHGNLPARSARTAVDAIDALAPRMGDFTVPLFIMHGAADKTTPVDGSRHLAERARSADKTLKVWDAQAHDLLHEPAAKAIVGEVVTWIDARVKPATPPAQAPSAPGSGETPRADSPGP